MSSLSGQSRGPRRHDLVVVSRSAWHAMLATRSDLATQPLITTWVDQVWPLIVRRALPSDAAGLPLGLPLPPAAGRRRIAMVMQPGDIVSTALLPPLLAVLEVAPRAWLPTLYRLAALAGQYSIEIRVSGSLAWQTLTGLEYLTDRSDLDLLLYFHRDTDVMRLTADLANIQSVAPMRLDGELISATGTAINWREFRSNAQVLLVKSAAGVSLMEPRQFLSGDVPA